MTKTPDNTSAHSDLKSRLASRNVSKVVFIDDAFDRLDSYEPLEEEQAEMWAAVQSDDYALTTATEKGLEGPEAFTSEVITDILKQDEDDPLRVVVSSNSYVTDYKGKINALIFAVEHLRNSLGLVVETIGLSENDWEAKVKDAQIVFLDWRLGPDKSANSIDKAVDTASAIHRNRDGDRPLIVLMSADSNVTNESDDFRRKSMIIGGMFDVVLKEWLKDKASLELQVGYFCKLLEAGNIIQSFISKLDTASESALKKFKENVMGLSLGDYANLQHFSLNNDGHPLGDYLTILFSGLWANILFEDELRDDLDKLDRQDFESLPSLTLPSTTLKNLYTSAVFDMHVGDFTLHPMPTQNAAKRLMLSLGDIIEERRDKSVSKMYIIINPQCDLAIRPLEDLDEYKDDEEKYKEKLGNREEKQKELDELSILLIPGNVIPFKPVKMQSLNSPLFQIDEKEVSVEWKTKSIVSVPYVEFKEWLNNGNRRRIARMRPLHALSFQSNVTSQLSRVGIPVSPPFLIRISVELRVAHLRKWEQTKAVVTEQGRLVHTADKKDRIVLTRDIVVEIKNLVYRGLEKLKALESSKHESDIADIVKSLNDQNLWDELTHPFPTKEKLCVGGTVRVCPRGKELKQIQSNKLMVEVIFDIDAALSS